MRTGGGFSFALAARNCGSRRHARSRSRGSWPTVVCVSQLSFFSAESVPPAVADLTGLLAATGQVVRGRQQGARLSVVVDRPWRAEALAEMIDEAGLDPEISRTDEDTPLVRTAVDPRLIGDRRRLDPRCGQDGAAAVAARTARAAGLGAGGGHARGGPLSAGPGPARARHPFAARVGADAGRDRTDSDRHPRGRIRRCGSAVADGYRAW